MARYSKDLKKIVIPNKIMLDLIQDELEEGVEVILRVVGSSMFPALLNGIDKVKLSKINPNELKKGDIILFKSKDGFTLHRITEIDFVNKIITSKGDANIHTEKLYFEDIVAKANRVKNKKIGLIIKYFLTKRYMIIMATLGIIKRRILSISLL